MSIKENNRKRTRSVDIDSQLQSKYFVNQRMVDLLDENRMKKIFDKTVNLLFEGAKNNANVYEGEKLKSVRLDGEGNVTYVDGKGGGAGHVKKACSSCNKDSIVQTECSNCNLNLCEFCGVSCVNCLEAHVCKHCVHLL
ncbi:hypothetical protein Bhyg_00734 [Pseudolycoriella hygida]|uniref:Apoptosis regulatory protein Siva n=1 Tax=Pseudolycoriella hygida TaxID=35572 RepID=A0A9Q0N833_9DIPT|nr:hypothetical protein Bhyg_00734 [Pseudolycoriella hygida]